MQFQRNARNYAQLDFLLKKKYINLTKISSSEKICRSIVRPRRLVYAILIELIEFTNLLGIVSLLLTRNVEQLELSNSLIKFIPEIIDISGIIRLKHN